MWGSVFVALVLVGLILLLYLVLNHSIRERQELHSDLTRLELTHEGIQAAIRHFRHDLGNMLGVLALANAIVRSELEPDADVSRLQQEAGGMGSDKLDQALTLVEKSTRQSLQFVQGFKPGRPEEPAPLDLVMLVRQLSEAMVLGPGAVRMEIERWVVRKPPVAMTILVGNLVKNALDCAGQARVRREGQRLWVENPVDEDDAEMLRSRDVYRLGETSKGEGHGVGLEGALQAAETCRVRLRHELFPHEDGQWVRFEIDFAPPPDAARGDHAPDGPQTRPERTAGAADAGRAGVNAESAEG